MRVTTEEFLGFSSEKAAARVLETGLGLSLPTGLAGSFFHRVGISLCTPPPTTAKIQNNQIVLKHVLNFVAPHKILSIAERPFWNKTTTSLTTILNHSITFY